MGILGCVLDYEIMVTARCGSPKLCELSEFVTSVKWQRTLDNISQATVIIAKTGDFYSPCCQCIGDIEPWCHELQIIRNGEFVWTGPIYEVDENVETVTITARDVLSWLDVRFFPNGNVNGDSFDFSANPLPVTEIAREIIVFGTAGKYDPVHFPNITLLDCDPCISQNLIIYPSTTTYGAKFTALDGTAFSMLQTLNKYTLDFTTFGRSIILGKIASFVTNPVVVLTSEMILGDISFKKDGSLFGDRFYMRFSGDDQGVAVCDTIIPPPLTVPCPAVVDAPNFYCHGLVERQIQDSIGNTSNIVAQDLGEQEYIPLAGIRAPRTIDFKSGATLSPETPLGINEIIPGSLIKTSLTSFCIDQGIQNFRLTDLNVSMDAQGETVQISMSPINFSTGTL